MSNKFKKTAVIGIQSLVIVSAAAILISAGLRWAGLTQTRAPARPDVSIGDSIDFDDYVFELPPLEIRCSPGLSDTVTIDWPHNIHITTDQLSGTLSMRGPATIRFSEEE